PASTFMAFGHLFKNLHGRNSQSLWTMFSLIYYVLKKKASGKNYTN
ncbi:unnamed protein product, partial [Rotaria sordida]